MTVSKYMRTGNVLIRKTLLSEMSPPFDPRLGRTGGEDADLFGRLLQRGYTFVWCQEARVHEEVPQERQKRTYHLQRAFLRGVTSADQEKILSIGTVKSSLAVALYTASLPVLALVAHHLFIRYLVKDCDHIAKLLAHCGVVLARERKF